MIAQPSVDGTMAHCASMLPQVTLASVSELVNFGSRQSLHFRSTSVPKWEAPKNRLRMGAADGSRLRLWTMAWTRQCFQDGGGRPGDAHASRPEAGRARVVAAACCCTCDWIYGWLHGHCAACGRAHAMRGGGCAALPRGLWVGSLRKRRRRCGRDSADNASRCG